MQTLLTCNSGGILKKMVGWRCVEKGYSNAADLEGGILVHVSPMNNSRVTATNRQDW